MDESNNISTIMLMEGHVVCGSLSPRHSASSGHGLQISGGSCEYVGWAAAGSQKQVVLQFRG